MNLKEIRNQKGLTQIEASKILGVSRRTYINYENNFDSLSRNKKDYIFHIFNNYNLIDETHGILTIENIKSVCKIIFEKYQVDYCYLFGSYAKNKAKEDSDVDLLISTSVNGIKIFGLIESLREGLNKKVDLVNVNELINNPTLLNEILKDGIKIYG